MTPTSPRQILEIWEAGQGQHPLDRALTLLAAAYPEAGRGALAELTVGERDARLLSLYRELAGPTLEGLADCPACGAKLEITVPVAELPVPPPAAGSGAHDLAVGEYHLRVRLPDSRALAAAAGCGQVSRARARLLEHCVLEARHAETAVAVEALPEEVIEALEQSLMELDPRTEITFDLQCPECSHRWSLPLEAHVFLWRAVCDEAGRRLDEVATLARAWGWSEGEILDLPAARRRYYLDRILAEGGF